MQAQSTAVESVITAASTAIPAVTITSKPTLTIAPSPSIQQTQEPSPTSLPSPTLSPTQASKPTLAPPPTTVVSDTSNITVTDAYKAVLLTKVAAVITEETAKQIADGKLSGLKSYVAFFVIGTILSATRSAFNETASLPDIQPVWDQGKTSVAGLSAVVSD